ncbi:MAG: hypothetical protein EOM20_10835, partial [Spartobacteria bacterium]|nr:hypothetical protein [Spartobacteria bacterium]
YTFCFVSIDGSVIGVIRRDDIEKPVVRMWLFGIIILIEIFMVQVIRNRWPGGSWTSEVSKGRMEKARELQAERKRRGLEADLVDCMIAMPGQLFYSTQIPVCLWFLTRNKAGKGFRDRRGETLFLDARKMGTLVDRVHRELTDDDVKKLAGTYHAWRGEKGAGAYEDVAGFCKSVKKAEIEKHGFVLTPGRYVGAEELEDDGEPFNEKMQRLTTTLNEQFKESARLEKVIKKNLEALGYKKSVY